ncbi:MAG: RsmD family RNA methyltransferase [Acidimicrobiales bacterium]
MRVIGGRSRGRRLSAKLPAGVRPTSDRVRESIFDILGSLGGVDGLTVVDLFCGSGALGVEALSRGAAAATFVDQDLAAVQAVRANLDAVGLADRPATVVRAALPGWLRGAPAFDLALCDPPYGFDEWAALLADLQVDAAVLESSQPIAPTAGWVITKERRYGGTLVTVAHRRGRDS